MSSGATAQEEISCNYTVYNGLPSNHVYGMICDKLGYEWVATDRGVARYNGYSFKVFNFTNGLPNEDIWQLFEDKKGRIWLCNISDELGYLYKDKYHKAFVKGKSLTLYPENITRLGDGIIFQSKYLTGGMTGPTTCIEKNDTIYKLKPWEQIHCPEIITLFGPDGIPLYVGKKLVYKITYKGSLPVLNTVANLSYDLQNELDHDNFNFVIGNYLVYYKSKNTTFNAINLNDWQPVKVKLPIDLEKNEIDNLVPDALNKKIFVVSNKNIFQFSVDSSIKFECKYGIDNLLENNNIKGSKIHAIQRTEDWGMYIGTNTNGLYTHYFLKNCFFKETSIDLSGYSFVGNVNDSSSFWWNDFTGDLAIIDKDMLFMRTNFIGIKKIKSISPYNQDTILLIGERNYFLNWHTNKLTEIDPKRINDGLYYLIFNGTNFFTVGTGGFNEFGTSSTNTLQIRLDADRYNNIIYDSPANEIWAYNYSKIFIHSCGHDSIIPKERLHFLGVKKIQKIAIDNKYQNVFIRGTDNIVVFNRQKNEYKDLFLNLNLKESDMLVYNKKLIVVGNFGVLFSKISGPMNISVPLVYSNVKNTKYRFVYGSSVLGNKLIMNTDKGVYKITIPTDDQILKSSSNSIFGHQKFIVSYRDTQSGFSSGDTLVAQQDYRILQFDVINPFGSGIAKYMCKLSSEDTWHELNANEIHLPPLFDAGKYHQISIRAYDDMWRSNEMALNIYMQPYWYQTNNGRKLVWLFIILLVLLSFAISIALTRKLVLDNARKRSLRMELELKAIYAQINPHFIFNSLNSALLLVSKNKMEEAYTHISKFSRLLRGYIKSSRNKLITLDEEISNLTDYIELQQVRFKNKLYYRITLDRKIAPGKISIPALLIQPFVENAINHGILPLTEPGFLTIDFAMLSDTNELICTIEDDGVGRRQSKISEQKNSKPSYGDLLIKDLVRIFNKYEQMNITFSYEDKEYPQSGTIVIIQIKNPCYAS